jgi:PPE-repeat protein
MGFEALPPEINSARIFAGAGAGPLFQAGAFVKQLGRNIQVIVASDSGPSDQR